MYGELDSSSPAAGSSPSTENCTNTTVTHDAKQKAKPFDINDFFLSDTLLPFTGGVSFLMP